MVPDWPGSSWQGPYCKLCSVDSAASHKVYYDTASSACKPCEGDVLALALTGGFLAVAAVLVCACIRPRRWAPRLALRLARLTSKLSLRAKVKQLLGFFQVPQRIAFGSLRVARLYLRATSTSRIAGGDAD